jgi:hypothetical protein
MLSIRTRSTSSSAAASCSLRLASPTDMELRALSDWYSFSDWKRVTKKVPTTQKAINGSADLKNLTLGLLTTYDGGLAANRAAALERKDMSSCGCGTDQTSFEAARRRAVQKFKNSTSAAAAVSLSSS